MQVTHKRAQRAWKTFVLCLSLGLAASGSLMAQESSVEIEDLSGRIAAPANFSPLQPTLTTAVPNHQLRKTRKAVHMEAPTTPQVESFSLFAWLSWFWHKIM